MAEGKTLGLIIFLIVIAIFLIIFLFFIGNVFGILQKPLWQKEKVNHTNVEEIFNNYIDNLEECLAIQDFECVCGEMSDFPATLPDKYYILIEGKEKSYNLTLYYDQKKEPLALASRELNAENIFVSPLLLYPTEDQDEPFFVYNPKEYLLDKYPELKGDFNTINKIYFGYESGLPQYPSYLFEVQNDEIKKKDKLQINPIISGFVLKKTNSSFDYLSYVLHIPYYGHYVKKNAQVPDMPIILFSGKTNPGTSSEVKFKVKKIQYRLNQFPVCEEGRQEALKMSRRLKEEIANRQDFSIIGLVRVEEEPVFEEIKIELPQGYFFKVDSLGFYLMKQEKIITYYTFSEKGIQVFNSEYKGNVLCEGQESFNILNGMTIYVKTQGEKGCFSLEE